MALVNEFITFGGKEVLEPAELLNQPEYVSREFYKRANGYHCPRGKAPGVGWLLMARVNADALAENTAQSLVYRRRTIDSTGNGAAGPNETVTIPSLYQVRRLSMSLQYGNDPKAPYLVEVADVRRILAMSDCDKKYNVRQPAPNASSGTGLYYSESLNAGSLWTWQTLLSNLWAALPSVAGTAPTLPYTPDGSPEGWKFYGVSAWEAIHQVLAKVGCTTAYNPFANTFSYVRLGQTDSTFSTLQTTHRADLMHDYAPSGSNAASVPATVRVYFHKKFREAGVEKDTPNSGNFAMAPMLAVDTATGASGAVSGTVISLYDDLPALYTAAGAQDNAAAVNTRAAEVAANYLNRLTKAKTPAGLTYRDWKSAFLPSSEISAVTWRSYSDGFYTDVRNSPLDEDGQQSPPRFGGGWPPSVQLLPPTHNGKFHPDWPRTDQLVQVNSSGASAGDSVSQNADGYIAGRVQVFAAGTYTSLDDCWIKLLDATAANQGDRFVGRLYGVATSGGSTKPVYVLRKGSAGIDCNEVEFQVVSVDPETRTALGEIMSRPCNCEVGDIPDTQLSGTVIEVCDPAGCFFNEPSSELTGRRGWARWMMPVVENTCQPDPNYLTCMWHVFSLCCETPVCETQQ